MQEAQPKRSAGPAEAISTLGRPSHLASLAWGLGLGALGTAPAWLGARDSFALLCWIACLAPAAGAALGALRIDPVRFGPVAPALWAVGLALVGAAEERASLPEPVFGALTFTGLSFAGIALGRRARSGAAAAVAALCVSATLIALPARAGLGGEPWPPALAARLLDLSPFVLLGEASGARDLAWHRSLYAAAGTDRFQRAPFDPVLAGTLVLALGLAAALLADRRARALEARSGRSLA